MLLTAGHYPEPPPPASMPQTSDQALTTTHPWLPTNTTTVHCNEYLYHTAGHVSTTTIPCCMYLASRKIFVKVGAVYSAYRAPSAANINNAVFQNFFSVFGGSGFYHPQGIPVKYDSQSIVHHPSLFKVCFPCKSFGTLFVKKTYIILIYNYLFDIGTARCQIQNCDVSGAGSMQVECIFFFI
jgi:hypothetical protein